MEVIKKKLAGFWGIDFKYEFFRAYPTNQIIKIESFLNNDRNKL